MDVNEAKVLPILDRTPLIRPNPGVIPDYDIIQYYNWL